MSAYPAIPVKVGQVWADNDYRAEGRTVRVVAIEGDKAVVELVTRSRMTFTKPGTRTRVALNRMRPTSTGYRLIQACSSCGRERTAQDTIDYHPSQVFTDGPYGWYSGDDGELCPEDFTDMMRKANG